jgi:hypothetical protein
VRAEKGVVMNRIAMSIVLVLVAGAAFALQANEEPIVAKGEVVAVSSEDRTVTLEEIGEPASQSPGAMQSGVKREFEITESTKLTASGEPIELAAIGVGAMAEIYYVMDSGKNIALEVDVRQPATE